MKDQWEQDDWDRTKAGIIYSVKWYSFVIFIVVAIIFLFMSISHAGMDFTGMGGQRKDQAFYVERLKTFRMSLLPLFDDIATMKSFDDIGGQVESIYAFIHGFTRGDSTQREIRLNLALERRYDEQLTALIEYQTKKDLVGFITTGYKMYEDLKELPTRPIKFKEVNGKTMLDLDSSNVGGVFVSSVRSLTKEELEEWRSK